MLVGNMWANPDVIALKSAHFHEGIWIMKETYVLDGGPYAV